MIKNKKGADKLISVYWFGILVLVAGGIFLMVSAFYTHPYDIRDLEAKILADKVADCLSEKGNLREGVMEEDFKNNFLGECGLIIDVSDPQYYVGVDFFSVGDASTSVFNIEEGNKNYVVDCNIQDEERHERLPKCLEERFYALDGDNQYLIKILSVVGKVEQNVK